MNTRVTTPSGKRARGDSPAPSLTVCVVYRHEASDLATPTLPHHAGAVHGARQHRRWPSPPPIHLTPRAPEIPHLADVRRVAHGHGGFVMELRRPQAKADNGKGPAAAWPYGHCRSPPGSPPLPRPAPGADDAQLGHRDSAVAAGALRPRSPAAAAELAAASGQPDPPRAFLPARQGAEHRDGRGNRGRRRRRPRPPRPPSPHPIRRTR